MSLREKTITGVSWSAIGRTIKQIIHFGITVLLARLLTPEDFGLIGMIVIFTGYVNIFSDAGFGAALIQHDIIKERHRSSIFWINIGIGTFLTIIVAAGAPLIALFYGEDKLMPLTVFISFQFVIGSLSTVQQSLLRRKMDFKSLTVVEVATQLISGGIAVVLALKGFGVWSLAWQNLIATATKASALWLMSSWRPYFLFNWPAVKELLGFSSNLLGFNLINYWSRQADDLLIGKFVGSSGLGIYTRAYRTMLLPISQVTTILSQVMFPALSKIKEDTERIKRIYLKSNRIIGLVSIPMMMGLIIVAKHFVLAFFGRQWIEVAPILQILCFVGLKQPLGSTTGWIYQSQGRTDLMFKWNIVVSIITVLSFIIGIQWGIYGIAIAYAIRSYVLWYPSISIPGVLIDMTFWEFLNNISGIVLISLIMAGCVIVARFLLPTNWPVGVLLLVESFVGVLSYIIMMYLFRIKAYQDIIALLGERFGLFGGP